MGETEFDRICELFTSNYQSSIFLIFLKLSIMSESEVPEFKDNCIFCKIAQKIEPTEIVYEEEDFIVFNDYRPAAEFHILVIPKRHYGPLKSLNSSHIELVKKLNAIANQ